MSIENTISKELKMNYKTNSFKVIETFFYNITAMVEMLRAPDLDVFTQYALKGLLITKKCLRLLLRVLKGTMKTQSEEAIKDFQNQAIKE